MSCVSDTTAQCPPGSYTLKPNGAKDPACSRNSPDAAFAVCYGANNTATMCPGSDVSAFIKAANDTSPGSTTAAMCVDPATNQPQVAPGCNRPSPCIVTKLSNGTTMASNCVAPAECRADSFGCVDGVCVWVAPGTAGSGPYSQCTCNDTSLYTCDPTAGCTKSASGGTDSATCSAACKWYLDPTSRECRATSDTNVAPGATRYATAALCAAAKGGGQGQLPVWAIVLIAVGAALVGALLVAVAAIVIRRRSSA